MPGSAGRPANSGPPSSLAPRHHGRREPRPRTSASRSGRSPVTTISLRPLHMGSAATMSARAPGCRSSSGPASATVRSTAASSRGSSTKAPAWSSAATATELVAGTAPSRNSFGRTTSASASLPVVKNPPDASSQNRSRSWWTAWTARSRQSDRPVHSESRNEASASQRVVGGHGEVARPPALPAAHETPAVVHGGPEEVADLLGPSAVVGPAGGAPPPRPGWPPSWHSIPSAPFRPGPAGPARRGPPPAGGGPPPPRVGGPAAPRRGGPGWSGPPSSRPG